MINIILEMLNYPFIARAVEVGLLVSLCSAMIGVSLVLKNFSMISNGLSNVSFGSISIAIAFGLQPLVVSLPLVIITSIILLRIDDKSKIKSDTAIALFSASALSIGVAVTAMTTGMNTDVCSFMFGSILAMSVNDVILSIIISVITLAVYIYGHNIILAVTFDPEYARASGINVKLYTNISAILVSVIVVIGMRLMGALLISALIVFPATSSMLLQKSFRGVTILAAVISIICFIIGILLSYLFNIPAGASIVIINIIILLIFIIINRVRRII